MRRFDMRLPAIVRLEGANEFHTETQNVSARGVYFYLDRAMPAGTKLEVTLTFPPHITLTDAVRVRFTARVIRVESPLPSLRIGTAAMIEDARTPPVEWQPRLSFGFTEGMEVDELEPFRLLLTQFLPVAVAGGNIYAPAYRDRRRG